ncbi:MAG: hypothetical protein ACREQ5_12595 [Candidatus Dormibacteria bacterium]
MNPEDIGLTGATSLLIKEILENQRDMTRKLDGLVTRAEHAALTQRIDDDFMPRGELEQRLIGLARTTDRSSTRLDVLDAGALPSWLNESVRSVLFIILGAVAAAAAGGHFGLFHIGS